MEARMISCFDENEDDFFGDQESLNGSEVTTQETMIQHEVRSMEQKFHNLGFQDGYDKAKELKLETGFEEGYVELIEVATRIGNILGENSTLAILNNENESYKKKADEVATEIKKSIVSFLELQGVDDGIDAKTYFLDLENRLSKG